MFGREEGWQVCVWGCWRVCFGKEERVGRRRGEGRGREREPWAPLEPPSSPPPPPSPPPLSSSPPQTTYPPPGHPSGHPLPPTWTSGHPDTLGPYPHTSLTLSSHFPRSLPHGLVTAPTQLPNRHFGRPRRLERSGRSGRARQWTWFSGDLQPKKKRWHLCRNKKTNYQSVSMGNAVNRETNFNLRREKNTKTIGPSCDCKAFASSRRPPIA